MQGTPKPAIGIGEYNLNVGRNDMSNIKRRMCEDCGMIAMQGNDKYCSFCDPDEYSSEHIRNPVPAGVNPFEEGYQMAKAQEKIYVPLDPWKDIVLEQLVVAGIFRREHEGSPRLAIDELVGYHIDVALDPAVSQQAEDLYEQGRLDQQKGDLFFIILAMILGATFSAIYFGLPL